jgi:hypothetical protein
MKGIHYALIVVALLVVLSIWKRKDILSMATGIIDDPPEVLAKADGVSIEVESLARAMESEESSTVARTAIGWAVKNRAKRAGKSITQLVTTSKGKSHGKYSRQDVAGGKYCATSKTPSRSTLQLAENIIAGKIPDPTKGAHQWDAPKAQAALNRTSGRESHERREKTCNGRRCA